MTGSLLHGERGQLPDDPHRRAVVRLDDGSDVAYRDVRRFGTWLLLEPAEVDAVPRRAGRPEPLAAAYGPSTSRAELAGRRAPVKAAILDQRTVAGVGNIYADEALWRAQIHPLTPAAGLEPERGARRSIAASARRSRRDLRRQGSTLRDYRLPDGGTGGAQHEFKVYGRGGEPCDRCGTPIEKIRVAGRGHWYCPSCQPYRARPATSRRAPAKRPSLRVPGAVSRLAGMASRTYKSEAIVLRSLRFSEADRILHLYTRRARPDRRDREGRPQDEVALRGPARAALARRADAARGRGRAPDDHRRRAAALPSRDARGQLPAERRA